MIYKSRPIVGKEGDTTYIGEVTGEIILQPQSWYGMEKLQSGTSDKLMHL